MRSYFETVVKTVASFGSVKKTDVMRYDLAETDEKEILIYRLRIHLKDGAMVEVMERAIKPLDGGLVSATKYRVHWQRADGCVVKRWDNAPHHPEVPTYPHHVHSDKEDRVAPSDHLNVLAILEEIVAHFPENQ
jgi:hypothetical protein